MFVSVVSRMPTVMIDDTTKLIMSSDRSNSPLTDDDPEKMRVFLYSISTGHMVCPDKESYSVVRCAVLSEYENLPLLCSTMFAGTASITSRLFDIFDLFHRAHFKSAMWYTVIKYIAVRLKELSTHEEYLAMPYSKIRPRCTTLFRYLPAFLEKEEHLLDYIVRWGEYDYDERKDLVPRLLEKIYVREVGGSFAKSLICKLFGAQDVGHEETKRLRTFVGMEKRSRHFCFEYQTHNSGRWHYVNGQVCEPIINSRFAIKDGVIFNLQSTYQEAGRREERYTFRSTSISSYEHLMRSGSGGDGDDGDVHASIVSNLKIPTFSTQSPTLDMVSTNANAGIYVYLSSDEQRTKYLHEQLYVYNCDRDEWHQLARPKKAPKSVSQSCLISSENYIYLVGGNTKSASSSSSSKGRLFMLDAREGAFKKLARMKVGRASLAACVFNERIYAAGGQNNGDGELTDEVEVFDLRAGKWSYVAPMKTKRRDFKLVPFGNKLWAIGKTHTAVEEYNLQTNSWSLSKHTLIETLGNPIIKSMLRPEPPYYCYNLQVLDALVF